MWKGHFNRINIGQSNNICNSNYEQHIMLRRSNVADENNLCQRGLLFENATFVSSRNFIEY